MRRPAVAGWAALLWLSLWVPSARAQYLDPYEEAFPEVRYPGIGVVFRDFGPLGGNPVPPQEAISYDIVMPVLGFNAGPVDILFGYGRFDAGGASREAIMIATTIGTEFPLTGRGRNGLALPVQFAGDFTKSQSAGPASTDFNVASTGIGAGLLYRHRSERLLFQVQVTEAVHWSTEGFSANTGVSYATIGEARLVLRGFLGLDGGVFGYRFRYQAWNMSDDRFDYQSLQHGPFFGILL